MADTGSSSAGVGFVEKLKSYAKTQKGFILASEIILSFIILICYAVSYSGGYTAAAICEMVFAIIFFIVFMMELDKQFTVVNWLWSDLFRAAIGAAIYFITSLVCVTARGVDGAGIAGGVFGLVAAVLFAYDTYTIFLQIKSSRHHTAASTNDRV